MDLMLDKKEQYKIYDDYLSIQNYQMIWEFVKDAPYKHGEVDYQGSYPIGMVHELDVNESFGFPTEVDGIDYSHINFPFPRQVNGCPLSRAYINYYGPRELAVFHIDDKDDDSVTLLYYPCPTLSYDEGGTTELMLDNQIVGIRSIANRLLVMKANILHRSTPFKSHPRFTIALKYNK